MMSLVLGLGVGCRARPGDASSALQPEPVPAKVPAMNPPPGCEALGVVRLTVEPAKLPLTCTSGIHECSGRATLTIQSCAARMIEFQEVMLDPSPPPPSLGIVRMDQPVRLAPGQAWNIELVLWNTGVYELELGPISARSGDPPITLGAATLTVDNPARERAERECRECNGDWGNHGMLGIEGCVCRTRDGGTPCDDGADCEGQCIEREPKSGFRCSELTTEFGCYSYLPEGWSTERHRGNTVVHRVCVD